MVEAGLDGAGGAAQLVDPVHQGSGLLDQRIGEVLEGVGPTQGVGDPGNPGFTGDDLLGPERHLRRLS